MYLKTTVYYTNLLHYTVPAYRAHTRSARRARRAGLSTVCDYVSLSAVVVRTMNDRGRCLRGWEVGHGSRTG